MQLPYYIKIWTIALVASSKRLKRSKTNLVCISKPLFQDYTNLFKHNRFVAKCKNAWEYQITIFHSMLLFVGRDWNLEIKMVKKKCCLKKSEKLLRFSMCWPFENNIRYNLVWHLIIHRWQLFIISSSGPLKNYFSKWQKLFIMLYLYFWNNTISRFSYTLFYQ